MKSIRRPLLSITLALCLFCLTVLALSASASAHTVARNQVSSGQPTQPSAVETDMSAANLNIYCQSLGYIGVDLNGTTAYDWHCIGGNGSRLGFSMTYACAWLVNDPSAEDLAVNFSDPYSWECISNPMYFGGLDLNSYCQYLGDTGVSLDGSTIDDWHCVDQNGHHLGIIMWEACQWQYASACLRYTKREPVPLILIR